MPVRLLRCFSSTLTLPSFLGYLHPKLIFCTQGSVIKSWMSSLSLAVASCNRSLRKCNGITFRFPVIRMLGFRPALSYVQNAIFHPYTYWSQLCIKQNVKNCSCCSGFYGGKFGKFRSTRAKLLILKSLMNKDRLKFRSTRANPDFLLFSIEYVLWQNSNTLGRLELNRLTQS